MPELSPAEFEEWDAFVERSPQGTVFAKSFWLQGFEELASGNKACVLVVRDSNGAIQGGAPLFIHHAGRRAFVGSPPLTQYSSLLLAPRTKKDENRESEWEMKTISGFLEQLDQLQLDRVSLSHAPALTDVREFTRQGWSASPRYTYRRLLDESDIVGSLSHNHRWNFRKAQKAGYTVALVGDLNDGLDYFFRIYEYSHRTIPGYYARDCGVVRTLCRASLGKGTALLYEAKDAGGSIQAATIIWLSCHATAMHWAIATTDVGRSDGATVFLMTKVFEDLRCRGYRTFDFCGANIRPIAHFKAGFNGPLVPYYATEWERPTLLRAARTSLRAVRAAMRRPKQ
jgi:hypothetical protein